jgi:hypothetical protein
MSEETTNPEESVETPTQVTPENATEKVATLETLPDEPKATETPTAHDDFDWSISNRHQHVYAKDEFERLEALYEKTLGAVNENEVIKARVSQITGGDAVLDINFKSDGLYPYLNLKTSMVLRSVMK